MVVGRLRDGRVIVFGVVPGYGRQRAWRTTVWPARARLAGLTLAGLRVVCSRSCCGCSCGVVGAWLSWLPHRWLGFRWFRRAAAGDRIAECCLCSRHVCFGAG